MKNFSKAFLVIILVTITIIIGAFSVGYANNNQFFLHGFIIPPKAWQSGNSGKVEFLTGSDMGTPYFNSDGKLFGNFWLESAGWTAFNHRMGDQEVKIKCPDGIIEETIKNKNAICPLTGAVWSENAGWIIFDQSKIGGSHSGAYYNPNSANIEGFGWSETLGWVPIFTGVKFNDELIADAHPKVGSGTTNTINWYEVPDVALGANVNFIGKVAVIGNIAGTKIFKVINTHSYNNQNLGYKYDSVQHAPLFNQVRKNVAQLTRNIQLHPTLVRGEKNKFIYNNQKDYCITNAPHSECYGNPGDAVNLVFDGASAGGYKDVQTIIVKGKDIIINTDFNNSFENQRETIPPATRMKTIIALTDEQGNGGNIYITENVKQIYAYIVAEGSVFSGQKTNANTGKAYISEGAFKVPQKQLYINGMVISKNTIGGVGEDSVCPVIAKNCTSTNAKDFDMSYFRNYNPSDTSQKAYPVSRSNLQDKIKNATVIIDYNHNVVSHPPVGLEYFQ